MPSHRSKPASSRRKKKRSKTSRFLLIGLLVGYMMHSILLSDSDTSYTEDQSFLDEFSRTMSDLSHSASDLIYSTASTPSSSHSYDVVPPLIRNSAKWSCTWFPTNHAKCDAILSRRIPPPVMGTQEFRDDSNDDVKHQRWIFFGDSTMKRLFDRSEIKQRLVITANKTSQKKCLGQVICQEQQQKDRCELNSVYGLAYTDKWILPDPNRFEGPFKYGAQKGNEFCTDCSGCQTHFLECSFHSSAMENRKCKSEKRVYGGYMTMEFARDRELQTPEFGTTQENIAAYISQVWNTPELVRDWGKPICVISSGNHDILLEGITKDDFISNVRWLLKTLQPECEHFIWLSNTANGVEQDFKQTLKSMKNWDSGVKDLIAADQDLLRYVEKD